MGSTISKHLFHLPETINVDLDNKGETCKDHLFVNADVTASFNLKGWEPITLKEERKNPHFVCWLRNQDRKPWACASPMTMVVTYRYRSGILLALPKV
ncbi:MAG: hypothetical protein IKX25_11205 [Bacteroidales bacterium]|nr:hypothetical protein [Bacteroidales bacterium]